MGVYDDRTGPLTNPDVIALVSVMAGLGVATGGYRLAHDTYLRDVGNYAVGSTLAELVGPVTLVVMLFLLGSYLGAGAVWVASRRASDILPLRVALGAASAGILGFLVMLVVGSLLPINRSVATGVTVLSAFYGARLTTKLRREKPADGGMRATRVALVGLALALATVLVSYRSTDFPATGDAARRDAWATERFKDVYGRAVAYARACPDVAARAGEPFTLAPVSGVNVLYYGPTEANADFTLEAVGPRGRATVHVSLAQAYPAGKQADAKAAWQTSGELLDGRHAVALACP